MCCSAGDNGFCQNTVEATDYLRKETVHHLSRRFAWPRASLGRAAPDSLVDLRTGKNRCTHVGIIVGMWVSGLIIANAMPRLFVVAGGSLGIIGAISCACFGGGGACMACLCMNDKIREAEQNGGSWFKAGGGPLAPDGWIGRHFVEPEIDAGDPPVVEAPAGADDVEAPSEP